MAVRQGDVRRALRKLARLPVCEPPRCGVCGRRPVALTVAQQHYCAEHRVRYQPAAAPAHQHEEVALSTLTVSQSDQAGPSLIFTSDTVPSGVAVVNAGHRPTGAFWANLVGFLDVDLLGEVRLECVGDTFAAFGEAEPLERLAALLDPLVSDPERITALLVDVDAAKIAIPE